MRRAALIALVEGFPVGIDFALEALGLVLGSGPQAGLVTHHPAPADGLDLQGSFRVSFTASSAACVRLESCKRFRMPETWSFMVLGDVESASAISRFVLPSPISANTCI